MDCSRQLLLWLVLLHLRLLELKTAHVRLQPRIDLALISALRQSLQDALLDLVGVDVCCGIVCRQNWRVH